VMCIDVDGTLWSCRCKSLLGKMQHGQTWLDNEFKKSGVEVVDVDVYERDIVAVTATTGHAAMVCSTGSSTAFGTLS
jgi:hypothetical protein